MTILSIIVPIYNVEKYLEKCLSSLIDKTVLDKYEVILIDDCSEDKSKAIAISFVQNHPEIFKLIQQSNNEGPSVARNIGLKLAIGDYVTFVDSDDWLIENSINEILESLVAESPDLLFFDHQRVWEDKIERCIFDKNQTQIKKFDGKREIDELLVKVPVNACTKVFKRKIVAEFSFPKGIVFEDLAVIPAIVAECQRVLYLPKTLYQYRQREGTLVSNVINQPDKIYIAHEVLWTYYNKMPNDGFEFISIRDLLIYQIRALFSNKSNKRSLKYLEKSQIWLNTYYPNWKDNHFLLFKNNKKMALFSLLFPLLRWKIGRLFFIYIVNYDRVKFIN